MNKITKGLAAARKAAAPDAMSAKAKTKSSISKVMKGKPVAVKGPTKGDVFRIQCATKGEALEIVERLSDAAMKERVAETVKIVSSDHAAALRLLRGIGVATSKGRLSKRYGG